MDTDILKTLQSIEKLLKSSSAFSGSKPLPTSAARNQQTASQKAGRDAAKAFRATTANLNTTNTALIGLNKSLVGLNTEVGRTSVSFGSLTSQMARFMASLTPLNMPSAGQNPLPAPAQNLAAWQNVMNVTLSSLASSAITSNSLLTLISANVAAMTKVIVSTGQPVIPPPSPPITPTPPAPPPPSSSNQLLTSGPLMNQMLQRMIRNMDTSANTLDGLVDVARNLSVALKKLTGDFFSLSRIGMGSSSNLYTLSKNAFTAGMSLKEYSDLIGQNITVAARAGSLDNFDKLISAADSQLAEMGIFGKEARMLQGSLAQSNTMMGVSQKNLSGAMQEQVKLFDKLHKSTNMTAADFAELVQSVSDNDQVQKELIGLAPAERAARRQQMLDLAATGNKLGLTAAASKELADALIKQRGETVKGRFEQAGRVRQLGQLTGMGGEGERAAQIIMKGRAASETEMQELRGIAGRLDKASQGAYEQGSLGVQSAMDFFNETLGQSNFGNIMRANRPAELAQDAGAVNNRDFGQHVGEFGQFVGELLKYVKGFNESVGPSILGAITAGLTIAFRGPIIQALQSGLSGGGGAVASAASGISSIFSSVMSSISSITSVFSNFTGILGGAGNAVETIQTVIRQTFNSLYLSSQITSPLTFFVNALKSFGTGILDVVKGVPTSLLSGAKTIYGGIKAFTASFGIVGGAISAIIEMFTGEVSTALNPSGGFFNRLGGMATAFFSSIPNTLFNVMGYVFGEGFGKRLQNGFDMFVAAFNGAVRATFSKIFEGTASILSYILPDDSKLVKDLKSWGSGMQDAADENFKVMDELWNNGSKTLASISDKNAKAAKDGMDKANVATAKAVAAQDKFNNVQYGMQLNRDAVISDANAILGSPQVQLQNGVKTGAVNTASDQQATAGIVQGAAAPQLAPPEMLAVLNSILGVMNENLQQQKRQTEATEAMAKLNRPTATFTPGEDYANRLLKQGTV